MNSHRVDELLTLLAPVWQQHNKLHLTQLLVKLAEEMKYQGELTALTDDQLIYHLKMRDSDKESQIPGLSKDHETDFKAALLKARGMGTDSESR